MSEPFLGEIRIMSFAFAPRGWAFCNGQLLPIAQNQALFSLLGTTYGGDGRTTFALPDLRSRTPLHMGASFALGQSGGEEAHTLGTAEVPVHTHSVAATAATATKQPPGGNVWAARSSPTYSNAAPDSQADPSALANAGGGQPHQNLQPYLVLNFAIALVGIFPSRS